MGDLEELTPGNQASPEPIPNNPAGRLLSLIQDVSPGDPNERMLDAWARTLDVEGSGKAAVFIKLGRVASLVDDVEAAVLARPHRFGEPEPFIDRLEDVRLQLTSPSNNRKTFIAHLSGVPLDRLKLIDNILAPEYPTLNFTSDYLEELLANLEEAEKGLGDLPPDIRDSLYRHIAALRESIHDVRITGIERVADEAEGVLGAMYSAVLRHGRQVLNSPLIWRFFKLLMEVGVRYAASQGLPRLEIPAEPLALPSPRIE